MFLTPSPLQKEGTAKPLSAFPFSDVSEERERKDLLRPFGGFCACERFKRSLCLPLFYFLTLSLSLSLRAGAAL